MDIQKSSFRIFVDNLMVFLNFGHKLFRRGVCDKPMEGAYKYVDPCETKGYNKEKASEMLNLSVRQFDRRVSKGLIAKGRKFKGDPRLYWDKAYIDRMSDTVKK